VRPVGVFHPNTWLAIFFLGDCQQDIRWHCVFFSRCDRANDGGVNQRMLPCGLLISHTNQLAITERSNFIGP
jgi:hypothetical protein